MRRLYAGSRCDWHEDIDLDNACGIQGVVLIDDEDTVPLIGLLCSAEHVLEKLEWLQGQGADSAIEVVFSDTTALDDALWTQIRALVTGWADKLPRRLTFSWLASAGERHCTFQNRNGALIEQQLLRDIHPEAARRVELWRLQNFHLERLASDDRVYAFIGKAKRNPKDERLFILAEVFGPVDRLSRAKLWEFERAYFEGLRILRDVQSQRTQRTRLRWNWMHFYIHPALELSNADLQEMAREFEPYIRGLSVREVLNVRIPLIKDGEVQPTEFAIRKTGRHRLELTMGQPSYRRLPEMSTYDQRVVQSSRRGCVYPYEIIRMLEGQRSANQLDLPHSDIGQGRFQEYDFNESGAFMPVARPLGMNNCGIVVGIMTNCTLKYPEGMPRVWLASDPTARWGLWPSLSASGLLQPSIWPSMQLPVEWIPVSSGAKISMDSGTENLDWTARVLREIILFTQKGGIINLIIHNVNVGAQSYWNAEASMLMHTKGCLIMTMDGSMVLTGKKAPRFLWIRIC